MSYLGFEKLQMQFPSLSWQEIQRIIKEIPEHNHVLVSQQLLQGMPWEYIIGQADFGPLSIIIAPPLLIPRLETWDWLEQAAKKSQFSPKKALDLGCGPGTLSLGWYALTEQTFHLTAVDIEPKALEIAAINFNKIGLPSWECYESSWFQNIPEQTFDLILSNPPYCDISTRLFSEDSQEDPRARFATKGGLEPYVDIFRQARQYLVPKGSLIVEHGADQGSALIRLANFYGLNFVECYHDAQGAWRATHFLNPL